MYPKADVFNFNFKKVTIEVKFCYTVRQTKILEQNGN